MGISNMTGQGGMMEGDMMGHSDMMAMMQSCMAMMRSMMGPSRWDQGNTAVQGSMTSMSEPATENATLEQANVSAVEASGEPAKDIHGH